MLQKRKICKGCQKEQFLWSKGLCRNCFNKAFPPKPIKKITERGRLKQEEDKIRTKKLHQWFLELWDKRPHKSEISGKFLGNEPNSCFFHHIFCKSDYPELEFCAENIIILTPDEHAEVEANPLKFEEVNRRRKLIKNGRKTT